MNYTYERRTQNSNSRAQGRHGLKMRKEEYMGIQERTVGNSLRIEDEIEWHTRKEMMWNTIRNMEARNKESTLSPKEYSQSRS